MGVWYVEEDPVLMYLDHQIADYRGQPKGQFQQCQNVEDVLHILIDKEIVRDVGFI